jgi:hypothetical protein
MLGLALLPVAHPMPRAPGDIWALVAQSAMACSAEACPPHPRDRPGRHGKGRPQPRTNTGPHPPSDIAAVDVRFAPKATVCRAAAK